MASNVSATSGKGIAEKAKEVAGLVKGKPYVWGGKSVSSGFDCSGYVGFVFCGLFSNRINDFSLNASGFSTSTLFKDVDDPVSGDIIYFSPEGTLPGHVGIVYNADMWVGSQSSTGVAFVNFTNPFWGKRSRKIRRLIESSPASVSAGLGSLMVRVC